MVDLEKETLRWWFSPRSWLWNSMRDSMASSTEPIWIRAILRSFLKGRGQAVSGERRISFVKKKKEKLLKLNLGLHQFPQKPYGHKHFFSVNRNVCSSLAVDSEI